MPNSGWMSFFAPNFESPKPVLVLFKKTTEMIFFGRWDRVDPKKHFTLLYTRTMDFPVLSLRPDFRLKTAEIISRKICLIITSFLGGVEKIIVIQ